MSLHFVKDNVNIDFVGKRKLGFCLSGTLILLALLSMFFGRGLNLGIDFAGGVIAQVQFQQAVADETLKKGLDKYDLTGLTIQSYGDDSRNYLLRFSSGSKNSVELRTQIEDSLAKAFPDNKASIERLEVVGPKVGKDLTEKGLSALFYAILTIAVYISGRFEQRWVAGAIMAACLWGGTYVLGVISTHFLGGAIGTGTLVCFGAYYPYTAQHIFAEIRQCTSIIGLLKYIIRTVIIGGIVQKTGTVTSEMCKINRLKAFGSRSERFCGSLIRIH